MKRMRLILGFLAACVAAQAGTAAAREQGVLYDVRTGRKIPMADAAATLAPYRILLVGEHHTSAEHHAMQLSVIRTLHEAGVRTVVGMEMFRSDSQPQLDRWISGQMPETAFIQVYYDNWNFSWSLYEPILRYARDRKIPVVGLNVSREITAQVARKGFGSLTEEQRGKLDEVACRVDKTYMEFVRRAYGAHAHGSLNFTYFCEAQLVWDNIMAIHALESLKGRPDAVMVIVTGNGHAWKGGIPAQIRKRSDLPFAVILPQIEGVTEPGQVDAEDADFLFLR